MLRWIIEWSSTLRTLQPHEPFHVDHKTQVVLLDCSHLLLTRRIWQKQKFMLSHKKHSKVHSHKNYNPNPNREAKIGSLIKIQFPLQTTQQIQPTCKANMTTWWPSLPHLCPRLTSCWSIDPEEKRRFTITAFHKIQTCSLLKTHTLDVDTWIMTCLKEEADFQMLVSLNKECSTLYTEK